MSKIGLFSLVIFSLLLVPFAADARSNSRGEDDSNRKFRAFGNSCEVVTNRIDKKIAHFDAKSTKYQTVYANTQTKLNELVDKYQTAGLNTANLQADLATLKTKTDKFLADRVLYRAELVALQSVDCEDPEAFRAQLVETRSMQSTLRSDIKDIKRFFKTDVKPELKSLRAEFNANA